MITVTTSTSTRGDLQAGGVDFPNGGEGDVTSSFDIGEEAAVVDVERREATGNEVKPPRGGDLCSTTRLPWPRATCSKTFLRAAQQALAPDSLLGRFKSAGNCTMPSATSVHGMGTMPLVGIIQRIRRNKQNH